MVRPILFSQPFDPNNPEHIEVIADSKRLAAGGGHVLELHLAGDHIRVLLLVRDASQFRVEVREQGRPLTTFRFLGIDNVKFVDRDAGGHEAGVTKVVLTIIRPT